MHVGTLQVTLFLGEGGSLKEKRHVVRGLLERLRREFHVSAAEVDDHDLWQRATLGIACVSNDSGHANSVLDKVLDYIEKKGDVSVVGVEMEILAL